MVPDKFIWYIFIQCLWTDGLCGSIITTTHSISSCVSGVVLALLQKHLSIIALNHMIRICVGSVTDSIWPLTEGSCWYALLFKTCRVKRACGWVCLFTLMGVCAHWRLERFFRQTMRPLLMRPHILLCPNVRCLCVCVHENACEVCLNPLNSILNNNTIISIDNQKYLGTVFVNPHPPQSVTC